MKDVLIKCIIGFCILPSCAPLFYAPNACNVPLFNKKNEAIINANYGIGDEADGFDVQAAYAITNHFAVMADCMTYSTSNAYFKNGPSNKAYTTTHEGGQYFASAAGGYFLPFKTYWVFENYAGMGVGTVKNTGPYNPQPYYTGHGYNIDNSFKKIFNQASIGYRKKYLEAAFSLRLAYISEEGVHDAALEAHYKEVFYLNSYPNFFVWEPAITVRVGNENLKLQAQFCGSENLSASAFPQVHSHYSLGIFYRGFNH